jgi:RluA family pseudouridine synthase
MEILHSDPAILVIDKPAGLPVLPDGWNPEAPYLLRMLEDQFADAADPTGQAIWVVHRLDKNTSGVMVFARSADAHRALNRQFEMHEAAKVYRAILQGVPDWSEKTARHPLRVNVGHKHRTAVDPRRGKPSETTFKVLERFFDNALIEAHLMTGRTHQVRAHAYALGYPLLGDELYSADPTHVIARPALHSYRLTITNPLTNARESYSAPYPPDFQDALDQLNS